MNRSLSSREIMDRKTVLQTPKIVAYTPLTQSKKKSHKKDAPLLENDYLSLENNDEL